MRYALKNTLNETIRHQEFDGFPPVLAPEKGLAWVADPLPPPEIPTQAQLDTEAANIARAQRDEKIAQVEWRILRHQRETRLGIPVTEEIAPLDQYIHALANVPEQAGFPHSIVWPVEP